MRKLFIFIICFITSTTYAVSFHPVVAEVRGPQTGMGPFIFHFNDRQSIQIYGRVNQAVMYANDGRIGNLVFFTTNDNSISRIGFIARNKVSDDFSILGQIEMGLRLNRSNRVNQIEQTRNDGIDFRKIELIFASKPYGIFYLGKGSMASDKTAKQDISGTKIIANSNVAKMGGGLFFRTSGGTLIQDMTNPVVGVAFNNIDGFKRRSRVRYDTPFYKGFSLAVSIGEEHLYDAAIRYRYKSKRVKFVGAAAYTKSSDKLSVSTNEDITSCNEGILECIRDSGFNASGSVLFSSGISVTGAGGFLDPDLKDRETASFGYLKLGYLTQFVCYGKSAFSIDYGQYRHFSGGDDRAHSWGLAAVQAVDDWHVRFYMTVRRFHLSCPDVRFKNIYVAATGALFTS